MGAIIDRIPEMPVSWASRPAPHTATLRDGMPFKSQF
jgi:hypothetical protein